MTSGTNWEVHDPKRRQRYAFRRAREDLLVDVWAEPGGDQPLHFHPVLEERFEVLEGRFRFRLGRRRMLAHRGDEIVVPAGVKHAFKNVGGRAGVLRVEVHPAGDLRAMLEDFADAARAGLFTRRGLPTSLHGARHAARLLQRYQQTTVVCWPPGARRLLPALARLTQEL